MPFGSSLTLTACAAYVEFYNFILMFSPRDVNDNRLTDVRDEVRLFCDYEFLIHMANVRA